MAVIMSIIKKLRNWNKFRKAARNKPQIFVVPGKFAYIPIPKCATRSINYLLVEVLLPEQYENGQVSFTALKELGDRFAHHLKPQKIENICRDIYSFSIVRHPVPRLYSAYKNKVLTGPGSAPENIFIKHGIERDISFEAFIEKVHSIPDKIIDRHLRSQTWYLCNNGKVSPKKIVKLEQLEQEWPEIQKHTGLPPPPMINRMEAEAPPVIDQKYMNMIRERYREDFQLLGYE